MLKPLLTKNKEMETLHKIYFYHQYIGSHTLFNYTRLLFPFMEQNLKLDLGEKMKKLRIHYLILK